MVEAVVPVDRLRPTFVMELEPCYRRPAWFVKPVAVEVVAPVEQMKFCDDQTVVVAVVVLADNLVK